MHKNRFVIDTVKELLGWLAFCAALVFSGMTFEAHADNISNPTAPVQAGSCLQKSGITLSVVPGCVPNAKPYNPASPVFLIPTPTSLPTIAEASVYSPLTQEIYVSRADTGGVSVINLYTAQSTQISAGVLNYAQSWAFNPSTGWICSNDSASGFHFNQFDPVSKTIKNTLTLTSSWGWASNVVYDPGTGKCDILWRDSNADRWFYEIDASGNITKTLINQIFASYLVYDPINQIFFLLSSNAGTTTFATFNTATHTVGTFAGTNSQTVAGAYDPDNGFIYYTDLSNQNLYALNTTNNAITSTSLAGNTFTAPNGTYNNISWSPLTHLLYIEDTTLGAFVYDPIGMKYIGRLGTGGGTANNIVQNYLVRFTGSSTWNVVNLNNTVSGHIPGGTSNAGCGTGALANNSGTNNTGCGNNALKNNTTGIQNTGIGANAGLQIITGSNNISVGSGSGPTSDLSNTINIGCSTTQSNAACFGNSATLYNVIYGTMYRVTPSVGWPSPTILSLTASPMVYTNNDAWAEELIIDGGSISAVSFKRGAYSPITMPVATASNAGMYYLLPGDQLTITYTGTPTLSVIPF